MTARKKTPLPHDGVYVRLGRSRIHGVAAIAIRDIPTGTRIFQGENERVVWMSSAMVRRLPKSMRSLYEDFGIVWGRRIGVPRSLNMLSVGWYVNHSARPNVEARDDGRFYSLRRIRTGEELSVDYTTYDDAPLPFRPQQARGGRTGARRRNR